MTHAGMRCTVFILTCVTGWVVVSGQEPQLRDVPSTVLSPPATLSVPLDPSRRATIEESINARRYTRAEILLMEEIEKHSRSPELLTLLGGVFFLHGKYLNSIDAMKKAEALAPLDNRSRFTLAMSYIILNHEDWARPELEKLAQSDLRNALYPYWVSRLDYDANLLTSAVGNARKALELDPGFMKAYNILGLCYEALGRHDEAVGAYKEAIGLNRQRKLNSPWPPLNLGALLIKLGRLAEAEVLLRESLRYDPKLAQAHYRMGLLLAKKKKDSEAIQELTQAATLDPTYAEPHYVLGSIYEHNGDSKKAETAWSTFQKLKKQKRKD